MWGKETIKKLKVEEVRGSGWHYRAERWPPHGCGLRMGLTLRSQCQTSQHQKYIRFFELLRILWKA